MNRFNHALLAASTLALALSAGAAQATTIPIGSEADLRNALLTAADGDTIKFTGNVTISGSDLPVIQRNLTIDGGGFSLDGANTFRGLFAYSGTSTIQNLTIQNARARGGDGGPAAGGGAGLGGALFVKDGANVTISNVDLSHNRAVGGNGGFGFVSILPFDGAGGGGGMGGNGGAGSVNGAGGGGGLGFSTAGGAAGGNGRVLSTSATPGHPATPGSAPMPGTAGIVAGAAPGGGGLDALSVPLIPGGNGGGGGGGGGPNQSAGGGGVGGGDALGLSGFGGTGGFGGGGGGAAGAAILAGAGGFGGGGGGGNEISHGGPGGFGGGSGAARNNGESSCCAFGGGSGGQELFGNFRLVGGGGAGMGGAIFVMQGGTLTVAGAAVTGSSVTAGQRGSSGGTGFNTGSNGSAFGQGMFLQGNGTVNFASASDQTFAEQISDQTGSGGAGVSAGSWTIVKSGTGKLTLGASNNYTGGTTINGGTLAIGSAAALGSTITNGGGLGLINNSALHFGGGTLEMTGASAKFALSNIDNSAAAAKFQIDDGNSLLTLTKDVTGSGGIEKSGSGTLRLLANTSFTGPTTITGGSLTTSQSQPITNNAGAVLTMSGTSTLTVAFGLTNAGAMNIVGGATATVDGHVTNNGTVTVNNASVTFTGGFTNFGTLITDPMTFTTTDFINNDPAAVMASLGDRFKVSNDVGGNTRNNTGWDTGTAILELVAGADNAHTLELQGIDLGANRTGLNDNFAWGTLELDASQTLELIDLQTNYAGGIAALYIGSFLLDGFAGGDLAAFIAAHFSSAFNIYYDPGAAGNEYLGGQTYAFGEGGNLRALPALVAGTPEPATLALLGLSLAGLGWSRRRKQ